MQEIGIKLRFIAFLCRFLPVQVGAPLALYHQIRWLWKDANNKTEVFSFMKVCMAVFRHESANMSSPLYKRSYNLSSMMLATKRKQWGLIGDTGAEGLSSGYAVYSSYFWASFDYLRWWSVSHGFSSWIEMQALATKSNDIYLFDPYNVCMVMKDYGYYTASLEEYAGGVSNFWSQYSIQDENNVKKWNKIVLISTISISLALAFWMAKSVMSNDQKLKKWKVLN